MSTTFRLAAAFAVALLAATGVAQASRADHPDQGAATQLASRAGDRQDGAQLASRAGDRQDGAQLA